MSAQRLFDLTGRVALVTGASRGIGLSASSALASHGAKVHMNSRSIADLTTCCGPLTAKGLQVAPGAFDAFDLESAVKAVDAIVAKDGRLDIVFLNAAIQARKPLLDFDRGDFDRLIASNLTSQWELGRHIARQMVRQGFGRIIFTGSILALMGRENVTGYTASKTAIHGIVRQWSAELAPRGITVNAIAPGYVKTQLTSALHNDQQFNQWLLGRTPIGRWAEPEDMSGAVVYLASAESGFMTGQILVIDGGLTTSLL